MNRSAFTSKGLERYSRVEIVRVCVAKIAAINSIRQSILCEVSQHRHAVLCLFSNDKDWVSLSFKMRMLTAFIPEEKQRVFVTVRWTARRLQLGQQLLHPSPARYCPFCCPTAVSACGAVWPGRWRSGTRHLPLLSPYQYFFAAVPKTSCGWDESEDSPADLVGLVAAVKLLA